MLLCLTFLSYNLSMKAFRFVNNRQSTSKAHLASQQPILVFFIVVHLVISDSFKSNQLLNLMQLQSSLLCSHPMKTLYIIVCKFTQLIFYNTGMVEQCSSCALSGLILPLNKCRLLFYHLSSLISIPIVLSIMKMQSHKYSIFNIIVPTTTNLSPSHTQSTK